LQKAGSMADLLESSNPVTLDLQPHKEESKENGEASNNMEESETSGN
jgi:hypothetical protein